MTSTMKYLIMSAFMLVFMTACNNRASEKQTLDIAKEVVNFVEQNNVDQAFEILKLHWPLSPSEVDNLREHTEKQREVVKSRYGLPIGVEFISTERVGKSLVKHTFIEKFEHHALKWQLSFYKPKDKWIINSVYWDDKISELY